MENCDYQSVNTDEGCASESDKIPWKYFFRQLLISSAIWTLYFTAGLCVGTPTVLIPQLKQELNATVIDHEMESWLYSCFGVAATPWVLFIPVFSNYVGRKLPYIISCGAMLATFIIVFFSVTPYHILISQVVQGFTHASNITLTVVIITEYVDPKYRGMFLTLKSASFFWGIWVANAIGTFFHWKYIAIAGLPSSVYTFLAVLHPESPHWLASKGKFEKCKAAFRWLHGTNEKSERELQNLILSQSNYHKKVIENRKSGSFKWKRFSEMLTHRLFYQPLGLSILMCLQYHFSGKLVCSVYAVDIIKKITSNERTAYTGTVLDGVTVIGLYGGSFMCKVMKRRTLYMFSSFIGLSSLFTLALYLYLSKLCIIKENNILSILILTIYSISISCGPMIMSATISGEIIPIRYQATCYSIQATLFSILFTLILKFTPFLFMGLGMHGTFFLSGLTAGLCTIVLYIYLPETKDKTLLEIENYFKDDNDCVSEEMCNERSCVM